MEENQKADQCWLASFHLLSISFPGQIMQPGRLRQDQLLIGTLQPRGIVLMSWLQPSAGV